VYAAGSVPALTAVVPFVFAYVPAYVLLPVSFHALARRFGLPSSALDGTDALARQLPYPHSGSSPGSSAAATLTHLPNFVPKKSPSFHRGRSFAFAIATAKSRFVRAQRAPES
jgi:hypothetical protein